MIANIQNFIFEFFEQSLQEQFYWTSCLSFVSFIAAIFLREFCRHDYCKGCGRLLGLGGFFLLFCYSVHATDVAMRMERIAHHGEWEHRTHRSAAKASEIAERPEEAGRGSVSITTPHGRIIRFTSNAGGSRLQRGACGCGYQDDESGEFRDRSGIRTYRPSDSGNGIDGIPDEADGLPFRWLRDKDL